MRGRLRADYKLVNAVGPDEERKNKSEFMSFLSKFKDIKSINLTDDFSQMLDIEFEHTSTRSEISRPEFFTEYRGRIKSLTTNFVTVRYFILRNDLNITNKLRISLDSRYINITCEDVAQLFDATLAQNPMKLFNPMVTFELHSLNFLNGIKMTMQRRHEIPFISIIHMSAKSP
ncbi:hypothetical protein AA23498_0824 [Acetobacter nitrogenifigens DSM 23921 = NBRC 105050]|uniref:Uncharacterized protein n=1 Tax=Acetobacter nitrogenifigens DSM 23921 = NBRC 105050 TaxID=1120919 RepID=A0A511XDB6_9PROT|nr:hypothetical protein [Acetobacter nitrogenifigens]GBQ90208.1 hypothetical protein AA23498_0824 [Acetobacter nitrogenifigens DSM 23921 = NBRC 105050]GEN60875.1 hypothetical protein ANI02nite_27590 [Acetobacter nitrogenifigens DSM 23921 = NBRC 105050]